MRFSALHHLFHKVSHLLRCLFLHLPGGVGVGAQGESCVIVPQHRGDCFHVHSILQCHGSEGMTKLVEATNGHSLVEAENAICYDIVRGYGLRRSLFWRRRVFFHGTKKQKTSVYRNV